MLAELYKEELPVLAAVKCQPCVSVIMPFDPKIVSITEIMHSLKIASDKIRHELFEKYEKKIADGVLARLAEVIAHLEYTTHTKSIAIYVSPAIQKVYYLGITVTEKVIVNSSFEIRDLVLNKKEKHEFLLLVISAKQEKIFVGNNENLKQIVGNDSKNLQRDLPEQVANFSDAKKEKETELKKFLSYIDKRLDLILKMYPLSLFVMTTEKTMGYFEQITKHTSFITGFVHGNFEDASEYELRQAINPQIENWKSIKERNIINRIHAAQNDSKLAVGINDVWLQANRKHGQLLVVEKDFYCPAYVNEKGETIFGSLDNTNNIMQNDGVDNIIERVLENGGDVEFVDELKDYQHIALIEYYRDK